MYEAWINEGRIGEYYFTPGWTSYHKRLQYQAYDITKDINIGVNVIGAILGPGWYKSTLGWEGKKNIYGDKLAFLAQLHIYFEDGSEEIICTNKEWKYSLGPILFSEFYDGEVYDARLELEGWLKPEYDDGNWKNATVLEHRKDILVAQENIPAKKMEVIKPVTTIITPKGEIVIDFGQNMVGFVRFKVKGNAGDKVVLKHAEVLDRDGNFYTANLRKAKQTVEYILKGNCEEVFEPHFTYQGFRYVKIEEYPGEININNFEGIVIYSGMETTGEFECSDELVNKLQKNIVWSQKGNFVDVPTDCPQRDERLGWTGDAQVFIKTACFNMDVALFITKWLHDLAADQFENGGVPFVIPNIFNDWLHVMFLHSSSGWGDAATICPWIIYQYYADKRLLEQQYQSMKKWVEYIRKQGNNEYLWNTGFHFGDWLALDTNGESSTGGTPKDLIATAFYAYSTWILSQAAKVLGYLDDIEEYTRLYHNIITEFRKEFVTPSGRLAAHTQTAYVLALMFDLLEKNDVDKNVERLVELLKEIPYVTDENQIDYALTTGFVGTPYLCHVLTKYGRSDIALKLLLRKKYPSWLYQVLKGATTIWEHWDGIKEDGIFWSANMNSFNHYAYGSIGDWMYSVVGGLNILEPGFKKFLIKPYFEYFNYVKLKYKSMYGDIFVRWEKQVNSIKLELIVPANTEAIVEIEKIDTDSFKIFSQEDIGSEAGIRDITINENIIKLSIGSGKYKFEFKKIEECK